MSDTDSLLIVANHKAPPSKQHASNAKDPVSTLKLELVPDLVGTASRHNDCGGTDVEYCLAAL